MQTALGTPDECYRDTELWMNSYATASDDIKTYEGISLSTEKALWPKRHTRELINSIEKMVGPKERRDNESKYGNIKISENAQKTDEYKTQTHETIETFSVSNYNRLQYVYGKQKGKYTENLIKNRQSQTLPIQSQTGMQHIKYQT